MNVADALCLLGIHNAKRVKWIDLTDYAAVLHMEHGTVERRCTRCGRRQKP